MDPKALLIPLRKQVGVLPENLGFRKNVPAFTPIQDVRTPYHQNVGNACVPLGTLIIYKKFFDMKT